MNKFYENPKLILHMYDEQDIICKSTESVTQGGFGGDDWVVDDFLSVLNF